MEMSRDAEKVLEKLCIYWVYLKGNDDEFIQRDLVGETTLKELEDLNLLEYDDEKVHLTPEGFEESGRIIRRIIDHGDKSSCGCSGSCRCVEQINKIIEGE